MSCNCKGNIAPQNVVKPRSVVDEARAKELVAGIIRYTREGMTVPEEWKTEYAEIVSRYPDLDVSEEGELEPAKEQEGD